jgi:SagB-type dehydrogenase family enzyme
VERVSTTANDGLTHIPIVMRARSDARLEEQAGGIMVVSRRERTLTLRHLSSGQRRAVDRLFNGGGTEDELAALVDPEGTESLAEWYWHLQMLERLGSLEYAAIHGERTLAVLVPVSLDFRMHVASLDPECRYALSTFAYVRRDDTGFAVESPLALAKVELDDESVTLLGALGSPRLGRELLAATELPDSRAAPILSLLVSAGLLQVCEDDQTRGDREAFAWGWCFADALFHFQSRLGRNEHWYGAKPDTERETPPPALKPPMDGQRVPLERPDLRLVASTDPPLVTVMEARHSIRRCAPSPITVGQVGGLLFRTARVRSHPVWKDMDASRPHPSGGACYPLELYLAVKRCDGLEPGLYHYDPLAHEVVRLAVSPDAVASVLDGYRDRGVEDLQVVVIMAARVNRVSWKYASVVYATILKEVGVLMQSLYLVATAMGLAPCAIGGGASDSLPRAVGIPPLAEATVGEFAIGSRP